MRLCLAVLGTVACSGPAPTTPSTSTPTTPSTSTPAPVVEPTEEQLAAFYEANGGRGAFPEHTVAMIEALLYAQDEVDRGELAAARSRIDALFAEYPLSTDIWVQDATFGDLNVGNPIAYYGLRMLDVVASEPPATESATLQMTAVVASCATVRRPTADGGSETVKLDIHPDIVADDARILHQSTALFRRWVQTITGGMQVDLVVKVQPRCTTVDYTDDGSVIVSYPDADDMIERVGDELSADTDLWWVVAPSGVPGDGSGFDRHFITGGMGAAGPGLPLFLSDDAWFTRKVEHLGQGEYSDVERRVYQPQWFQHEFMHHLYRVWPEFGLEDEGHQWFDRGTWPKDFVGRWEPDYYAESIAKRLLAAKPSLAEGLQAPEPVLVDDPSVLVGSFERQPVLNGYHEVTVTLDEGALTWSNAAGVSWSLQLQKGRLFTADDCPYGVHEVLVELGDDGQASALRFLAETYVRL
ncbi:MAG: hypothetical protein KTR31_23905 [Myxococcales bacterium]|nr:hypothetical protein [Myxococcales bacterium]